MEKVGRKPVSAAKPNLEGEVSDRDPKTKFLSLSLSMLNAGRRSEDPKFKPNRNAALSVDVKAKEVSDLSNVSFGWRKGIRGVRLIVRTDLEIMR